MSWEHAKEEAETKRGLFVKLADGDEAEGAFIGEPHICYKAFDKDTKKSVEYDHYVEGTATRFRINFAAKDGSNVYMKILEGSKTLLKDIVSLKDEVGLDKWFKIKRKGAGLKTKYMVIPKDSLTAEDKKKIEGLEPLDLRRRAEPEDLAQEDVPF